MLHFLLFLAYAVVFVAPLVVALIKKKLWGASTVWLVLGTLAYLGLYVGKNIYVDVLWFRELGQETRYWVEFWTKFKLFWAGFLASFIFFLLNIRLTRMKLPKEVELPYTSIAYALSFVPALIIGLLCRELWLKYLLYANQVPFADFDPIFGKNVGFYVFSLPFLKKIFGLFGFCWTVVIIALLAIILLYVLTYRRHKDVITKGWEKPTEEQERQSRSIRNRAITHCSLLGIIIVVLMVIRTQIGIWNLLYSGRGAVFGAGWTDVHLQIGINHAFQWVLVICGLMFVVSALARNLRLTEGAAIASVGLGIVFMVAVVWIYPAIIQHFRVTPNEFEKERPYILHNIEYTRKAYGLDRVKEEEFPVASGLTPQLVAKNRNTIDGIRIWDWRVLDSNYNQTQSFRLYYYFADVDILRYSIGGKLVQVMASARELDQDRLAGRSKTWQNKNLVYTHGYGACLNPVNVFTSEGSPEYWIKDIPPVSKYPELKIDRPEIYFGELTKNNVFVRTSHPEFDLPKGETNATCFYQGTGGVELGTGWRRLLLALNFHGIRQLTASELKAESRIMFRRQIQDRIPRLAPSLFYDNDPYQPIADRRIWFIWDAYTTTNDYPYSQRTEWSKFVSINYIRNSVKVVMDAYNGKVDFYIFDEKDPLIRTYQKIFPGLFKSRDEMPDFLRVHTRYPEDLIRIQAEVYATYHMNDPNVFYNKEDVYDIATEIHGVEQQRVLPYYVILKIPGEENEEFVQMIPFTPHTTDPKNPKNNMVAWMAGRCDGKHYGEIVVYDFPKDRFVTGPMQLDIRINEHDVASQDFTLWNQQGSSLIQANLLVVPLSDYRLLYVKPIYLQATAGKMPELKRVVVSDGERIAYASSFEAALKELVVGEIPTQISTSTKPSGLLEQASQYYQSYQALVGQGKMKEAGEAYEKLGGVLRELLAAKEKK